MSIHFTWQEKYTEAMLELSRGDLPRRIDAAEKAIYRRLEELKNAGASSAEELRALNDALRGLRVLSRTECASQRASQADVPLREVAS